MPTPAPEGRLATLELDPGTGFVDIGKLREATLSRESDMLDSSVHGPTPDRTFKHGRRSATIEIGDQLYDETNAGQEQLRVAFEGRTTPAFRFRMEPGAGNDEYTALGLVTSFELGADNEGLATFTTSIQLSGAITRADQ